MNEIASHFYGLQRTVRHDQLAPSLSRTPLRGPRSVKTDPIELLWSRPPLGRRATVAARAQIQIAMASRATVEATAPTFSRTKRPIPTARSGTITAPPTLCGSTPSRRRSISHCLELRDTFAAIESSSARVRSDAWGRAAIDQY